VKKIEYRSGPTKVWARVFLYASLGRYPVKDEARMMQEYGITDVACARLPRGVIVGSVELVGCDGGDWHLRKPERATKLAEQGVHARARGRSRRRGRSLRATRVGRWLVAAVKAHKGEALARAKVWRGLPVERVLADGSDLSSV
jgi:hypothetical protein